MSVTWYMPTQGIYQFGDTAMLLAAINGHTEIIRLLLQHGAEVNQHNTVTTHVVHGTCPTDKDSPALLHAANQQSLVLGTTISQRGTSFLMFRVLI